MYKVEELLTQFIKCFQSIANTLASLKVSLGSLWQRLTHVQYSLASHTLCTGGSSHTETIELSPQQTLAVTNEIRALHILPHGVKITSRV